MTLKWLLPLLSLCFLAFLMPKKEGFSTFEAKEKLSEYQFFTGKLADLQAAENLLPYQLNTPLFSDYAEKLRFISIPKNAKVTYNEREVFDLPIGTVIIKNFFYYLDAKNPQKGKKIMETRLLARTEETWVSLPYIWNEEQTEAYYEPVGDLKEITRKDENGKKITHYYAVPNENQCNGCHIKNKKKQPIGINARQLNGDFPYKEGTENQLLHWKKLGILEELPDLQQVPKLAVWNDEKTGDLNARARAWLDINCGHCHNPKGPANTSGFHLDYWETDLNKLGVHKSPIAAGGGGGNRNYDIDPGNPDGSILIYRMESMKPGEMMPEIGRKLTHKEGLALIREWILKMEKQN
jgi:uncharacterized repeat protein (TIGR03806 family)